MAFQLTKSDGSQPSITIPDKQVDNQSTSLTFVGFATPNYGTEQQNNFLHLLENFAASTSPVHPITGQLWYDKGTSQLNIYNGSGWTPITSGGSSSGTLVAPNPPSSPSLGLMWFNNASNTLSIYDGSSWVALTSSLVSISGTAPSNPSAGQFWYDTTSNVLKLFVAGAWTSINTDLTNLTIDCGVY